MQVPINPAPYPYRRTAKIVLWGYFSCISNVLMQTQRNRAMLEEEAQRLLVHVHTTGTPATTFISGLSHAAPCAKLTYSASRVPASGTSESGWVAGKPESLGTPIIPRLLPCADTQ
jgi:hypothetical protein